MNTVQLIPKYMKAAVLWKTGKKLLIEDKIEIPKIKTGQVLVKIAYSGICHSQLMEVRGFRGKDFYLPHLLGHEACGKVLKIGKNVKKIKQNDWVILGWIKSKGYEAKGAKYKLKDKIINSGPITTFSNYSVVSENRLVKLPSNVPIDEAVLYGCAIPTGAGMVFNQIHLNKKNSIAFIGIGGVGLISLIAAKTLNCKQLIAIDTNDHKLKLAKKYGATHLINAKKKNIYAEINKITNFKGVDFSIDAAGKSKTIENAFNIINKNYGVCTFCSHPHYGEKISLDPFELISGKKIQGSWGGGIQPDIDLPKFAKIFRKKNISFKKLINKTYKLEEINDALNDLKSGKVLRPLIVLDENL